MAEKSEGIVIAVLASAIRMNDAQRSIKELPLTCFPSRLEDYKAWIRACGQSNDQILDQHTWSALARLGGGALARLG